MQSYKEILKSVAPLVIVVLLSIFTARFTLSKVSSQNSLISKFEKDNRTLAQKVGTISSVAGTVENDANAALMALPDSNSSLLVTSQIKIKALENSLRITSFKSGSELKDPSGLSRVDIAFEVDGPKSQIVNFINSLSTVAPMMLVDKVEMSQSSESTRASVAIKGFWTALPKTIPAASQAFSDLTEEENNLLVEIESLVPPQFSVNSAVSSESLRTDPFTQ